MYTLSGGQWAVAGHTACTSTHPANLSRDRISSPSSVLREIPDMKVYIQHNVDSPLNTSVSSRVAVDSGRGHFTH